jgi:cephalosporin hydroxylase
MNKHELLECIKKADSNPAKTDSSVLTGFSGAKILSLLKNLATIIVNNELTYLEVGVYRGLTLLSVAGSVPEYEVFGIDNFAFFDKDGKNLDIIKERMNRFNLNNASIINEDFEDALENLGKFTGNKKTGLYFIDGPHDYRSQLIALMLIRPWLSENAIIIIDDCNYRHVRQANRDFLMTNQEYKLIFQAYTKAHPENLKADERGEAEAGWWNGINVIVRDPFDNFEPFFPPVVRDKNLFTNDHHIHTARYPNAFRKYSGIVNILASVSGMRSVKSPEGKYRSLNTYSNDLTCDNYNPSFFNNTN